MRRVPKDWQHPIRINCLFQPLFDEDFEAASNRWKAGFAAWELRDAAYFKFDNASELEKLGEYWEYVAEPPLRHFCRPKWSEDEMTHFQMFENDSEGTPISPVMESPESLARWLTDNGADAGVGMATYDEWLAFCRGCPVPPFSLCDGEITSGIVSNSPS